MDFGNFELRTLRPGRLTFQRVITKVTFNVIGHGQASGVPPRSPCVIQKREGHVRELWREGGGVLRRDLAVMSPILAPVSLNPKP